MSNGFPFVQKMDAALSVPISGTMTSGATQVSSSFIPELGRSVYVEIIGAGGATGTINVVRSRDGGTTKFPITRNGVNTSALNPVGVTGIMFNEDVDVPESANFTYYIIATLSAGSISYNIFQ